MGTLAVVATWSGRILAVALLAVWGAFFVEHLEWFLHPSRGFPPAWVWGVQVVHLAMLVGLLSLIRWEISGGIVTLVTALVFFAVVAGPRFPLFFGVTALPVGLIWLGRFLRSGSASVPPMP